jgi:hypothetical protein
MNGYQKIFFLGLLENHSRLFGKKTGIKKGLDALQQQNQ